jgi:hypothetical protein
VAGFSIIKQGFAKTKGRIEIRPFAFRFFFCVRIPALSRPQANRQTNGEAALRGLSTVLVKFNQRI